MPVTLPLGGIAALVAIVIVGTLGAYMLYLQGVNDAGPVKASLLCCVEPVSAMILALAWLHTPVSGWDLAGCALIVIMIFLVTEREPKTEQAAEGEGALADAYDDPPQAALRCWATTPAVRPRAMISSVPRRCSTSGIRRSRSSA